MYVIIDVASCRFQEDAIDGTIVKEGHVKRYFINLYHRICAYSMM